MFMKKTMSNYSAPAIKILDVELMGFIAASPNTDGIEDAVYGDEFTDWS